ncbi:MAG TPA: M23 family metallopeptidase [Nitrospira sp.]|nr:M23 family metallopeptidase [Nitrospira sp.]
MYAQIVVSIPQGTRTESLVSAVADAFAGSSLPVKVQDNIPRRPQTGGPGWFSIDLVVPVVQATSAILLASGLVVGAKKLIRAVHRIFPGSLIRILSDERPTVAYQTPFGDTLDAAIDAIPLDYSKEKSTRFVLKRWRPENGWEIDLTRTTRKGIAANPTSKRNRGAEGSAPESTKRSQRAQRARSQLKTDVDAIVSSVKRPITHRPAALSELDVAILDLHRIGESVEHSADAAYVGEALEALLSIRQQFAGALMARWAQQTGIHEGVDLATPSGTRITALHSAIVVDVGIDGYGDQAVRLRERDVDVILGHLSKAVVQPGQRVRRGQLLGFSGEEGGISTGPHVHVEVRPIGGGYGSAVDPMPYLHSASRAPRRSTGRRLKKKRQGR